MNREYEIGLIINPETAEEEAEKIKTSITDILEKGKGSIENIDDWGRKALAYPIQKHTEGIYVFIKTLSPGDVIAAVERRLKLNEKVMRFIVIRLDDKLKKTNKLEKKWRRIDKLTKRNTPDSEGERVVEKKEQNKVKTEEPAKPAVKEKVEKEVKTDEEVKAEKPVKTEPVKEKVETKVAEKPEKNNKEEKAVEEVENAETK